MNPGFVIKSFSQKNVICKNPFSPLHNFKSLQRTAVFLA